MYGIGFMVYHLGLKIECFKGKLGYLSTLYGIGQSCYFIYINLILGEMINIR
jgi:hypothetical protein